MSFSLSIAPVRRLTLLDWAFVLFSWMTLCYLLFNILELYNAKPFNKHFDLMPIAAGVLVITCGWWGVRVGDRVERAVSELDDGAGLERSGEITIESFQALFRRRIKVWSTTCMGVAMMALLGGLVAWVIQQGPVLEWTNPDIYGDLALLFVLTVAGSAVGVLLGRFVGYGTLWRELERNQIQIASLATPQARAAVRALEKVFAYAVLVTTILCHWNAFWWVGWQLGFIWQYRDWQVLVLPIWFISLVLLILAGRPIRAFDRRVDQLYGGTGARAALDQMLREAQDDRRRILSGEEGAERDRELAEVDAFILDLSARRFRSALLNPRVMDLLVVWNVVLALGPPLLVWSGVIKNQQVTVETVIDGSPAAVAGFQQHDRVLAVDGSPIHRYSPLTQLIWDNPSRRLVFDLHRGGQTLRIEVVVLPVRVPSGIKGVIGASFDGPP